MCGIAGIFNLRQGAARPERFPHANLPRTFGHGNQHDVHHTDSADRERERSDDGQNNFESIGDAADEVEESFMFGLELVVESLGDTLDIKRGEKVLASSC